MPDTPRLHSLHTLKNNTLPTRGQLLMPLLETVQELGGHAKATRVIEQLNDRLNIPNHVAGASRQVDCGTWGMRQRRPWRQHIHWVRMDAVHAGLLERTEYGYWTLTDKGNNSLHNCQPGLILVVYETPNGQAVWADAMTAAGQLADESVQLLFTSPPYPLAGPGRKYGNLTPEQTIKMIVGCAEQWKRALKNDGSIVLNLRDCWLPKKASGGAVRSLYQEKILLSLVEDVGLYFADRFFWKNPSHIPDNGWITIHKVRTNLDVEQLFWLSKSPNPKANNQTVLVDAAQSTIQTYLRKARRKAQTTTGPSGHKTMFEEQVAAIEAGKTLKVIPRNLLEISNGNTHRKLKEALQQAGLPRHDASMPLKLAEFFVKFLTETGDLVADPFLGSGTTALAAEQLQRRWIGSDRSLAHLLGSAIKLNQFNPQFQPA